MEQTFEVITREASNSAVPPSPVRSDAAPTYFCETCYKQFDKLAQKKQHIRRATCRGNMNLPTNPCSIFGRDFNSYAGLRQHMRLAHPAEYNQDNMQAVAASARELWTTDEELALACMEVNLGTANPTQILDHLCRHSTRSREAIKKRRQKASYKATISRLLEESAILDQSLQSNSLSVLPEVEAPHTDTPIMPPTMAVTQEEDLNNGLIGTIEALNLDPDEAAARGLILQNGECSRNQLDQWVEKFISDLSRGPMPHNHRNGPSQQTSAQTSRRRMRAALYRKAQSEYKSNMKTLAQNILDNDDWHTMNSPDFTEATAEFTTIFSQDSCQDSEPIDDQRDEITIVTRPIDEGEIKNTLERMTTDTPGLDNIPLKAVKRINLGKLVFLFNSMLLLEYTPSVLKESRTVFIPKVTSEKSTIKWRPITISSVIIRVFHKILARRLEALALHPCQRGFSRIDGCFANVFGFNAIVKARRQLGKPLCALTIDIAKAFDTVSHHSVIRALRRLGVDKKFLTYIQQNLTGARTNILGTTVAVNRGVKQGDPLSPILFNAVIDELICRLQHFSGIKVNNTFIRCLAYADDLVILAQSREDAVRMIELVKSFLENRGMKMNASKSAMLCFRTVPSKKKVAIDETPLRCGQDIIKSVGVSDHLKYLGAIFSTLGERPTTASQTCPLKPHQKLRILKEFLIPRCVATMQHPSITRKTLKEADRKIRVLIKNILHLNPHCHNSTIHAPIKYGGLGIFCLSERIPNIILQRVEKLRENDEVFSALIQLENREVARIKNMVTYISTKAANHQHHAAALNASFSGCKGLSQVATNNCSNQWVYDPPQFWSGEDYVKAIQLRFNLLPCKGIPSNPIPERRCRGEHCRKQETVCHILQACNTTHIDRINRHNMVQNILAARCRRQGWDVAIEKHIYGHDGIMRKPDLILKKNDTIIVADVGVHWEGEESLDYFYHAKVQHYSSEAFLEKLRVLYPGCSILVLPFIMGARGAWCRLNDHLKAKIGLSYQECRTIVACTLKGGVIAHSRFMRYVWERQTFQR